MLKVIDLHTIDMIFNQCTDTELRASSKMLYINCLMHHFRGKEATFTSSHSFELTYSELKYSKYQSGYDQLKQSGLITYHENFIRFENRWNDFIDHSRFDRDQDNMVNSAEEFREILKQKKNGLEIIAMRTKLSMDKIKRLIDIFIDEQSAVDKTYRDENDCYKHFMYWSEKNKHLVASVSSSTPKILGQN